MADRTMGRVKGRTVPDVLPVAYRALIERVPPRVPVARSGRAAGWPDAVLVLDTETTVDAAQQLMFGSWRVARWTDDGGLECLEEGLIYADDLPSRDPDGWAVLQAYVGQEPAATRNARRQALRLLSRREFVNDRLWKALDNGALIVGYNLPFDLTRLAIYATEARGTMFAGGFSLSLFEYQDAAGEWRLNTFRPWLRLKQLDSKRALMGLARRRGARPDERRMDADALGRFLDLKALAFALTAQHLSLERAAQYFGIDARKLDIEGHGVITHDYIAYNRQDVALTLQLLEALRVEWDQHGLVLAPDKVMSPASLAKAYLRKMDITPPRLKFADLAPSFIGASLTAYYGGRSEVRVRRVPVPVVYVDFLSMYPTVNVLLGLWQIIVAKRVKLENSTAEVRQLGEHITLGSCFDPGFWTQLRFFARIRPDGAVLPVRAEYNEASNGYSIGVNPLTSHEPVWVSGPDLVASWVLTGKWPDVVEAVRLVPDGIQDDLATVQLRSRVTVDPRCEDFFQRVIEARQEVKKRASLSTDERSRLDKFLKLVANAGSYGVNAELNPQPAEQKGGDPVLVYGRDGAFEARTHAPEDAGEYAFPPAAALITGGARLMLALLERVVADAGGAIAFGDTDSGAIVGSQDGGLVSCPGGSEQLADGRPAIRALSWADIRGIVQRFEQLNPYDRTLVPGSVLKIEDVNFDDARQQQQLYALAISAKRYALFTLHDGAVRIADAKEHGLGHLLNPIDPAATDRDWIRQVWAALIAEALGKPLVWPEWVDQPAVSRVSVSTIDMLRTFDALNTGRPYAEQVKPTNFGLSVTVARLGHPIGVDPTRFHLLAPFERDPRRWFTLPWIDKYSGQTFRIGIGLEASPDAVIVKSYRDVLEEYRTHPEPKSLAPDGTPCARDTVGLLTRRPVCAGLATYIGKESNALEAVQLGLVHEHAAIQQRYRAPGDPEWEAALPLIRAVPVKELARVAGVSERMVKHLRAGTRTPSQKVRRAVLRSL